MSESKNEWHLLLPILPFLAVAPYLRSIGWESVDAAYLIVVIPLLTFPLILILGQMFNGNVTWKHRYKEGGIFALGALALSLSIAVWILYDYLVGSAHFESASVVDPFSWLTFDVLQQNGSQWELSTGFADIGVGVWIDSISLMLLFVATFLCFLICWFSLGYMNKDSINEDRNHRFYGEFVLFGIGMFGMVLADNFLWLFIFWEIMGLCSYLLIGFYFWKESAAYAAKKAFLTTRVGDVFLVVGLVILYDIYGSLEFAVIFDDPSTGVGGSLVDSGELFWALMMLFIGAVGKSAQFPLHVWLPDAMEGPTPVSALIHAATMVNAGLYLVARMVPFVDIGHGGVAGLEDLGLIIAWIGGITAFMAAAIAFVQNDIKKVLAYSTMSQLAYIFTGLGAALFLLNIGEESAGYFVLGASMFHLFNHAMAKGMLFMASGSVVHELHHAHDHVRELSLKYSAHEGEDPFAFDPLDMRNMGGLAARMPVTATAMMFGSMSIIGIPLIGGFWSKEGIIAETWAACLKEEPMMFVPALLILATAGMTGFYMTRMWLMTFAGSPKSEVVGHVHEATPWIKEPLIILTLFAAIGGFALAVLGVVNFLGGEHDHLGLAHGSALDEAIYQLEQAFLPEDASMRLIGWTTILLALVIGPVMASRIYGGRLIEGVEATPLVAWLVNLSSRLGSQDVDELANSQLAEALQRRLYFDDLYEMVLAKTVVPFAAFAAWFDQNVIDGVIKQVESNSVFGSVQIRRLTTGSARDYILMAAVGMLSVFALVWGVSA
jgi:NADH-quinone oxidoreductase subunit L